jgi:glucosamine--fructose-6-phosphate aminotransferase (isomerizing)
MCGIAGIVSVRNISDRLLRSIKNLEYRGYDSCGVAILTRDRIEIRKEVGTVEEVDRKEKLAEPQGFLGISHTRWATHGKVTQINSHPHLSCDGTIAVVHNGIISNYRALKDELIQIGHRFVSETDTEVISHLIEEYYKVEGDIEKSLIKAFQLLEGTYAFALISTREPDKIFCARRESPLVLGVGSDSMFVGSDINAFVEFTKDIVILEDGEYAIITANSYSIKDGNTGSQIQRKVQTINWSTEVAQKGGYPHFMLKEIHEQPDVVKTVLNLDTRDIQKLAEMILESERTYLVGVGTTYYVSLAGQYYFSKIAGCYLPAVSSDEFEYVAEVNPNTLFLCASQSGETYDTLKALRYAKKKGSKTAAIVNVIGSSVAREVNHAIMQSSGPEICVLSTKAALAQIVILLRTALELARLKGCASEQTFSEYMKQLELLPQMIRQILDEKTGNIRNIAYRRAQIKNWLFLGRGIYMAVAMEAALKMKEVTYQHAEGMPGGFMKHGTIALIDDDTYTLVLVPPHEEDDLYHQTMSNVEEIKARKGFIVGFHHGKSDPIFDEEVVLPDAPPLIAPLLQLVVGQLFAYFSAVALKRNVDKPRSLAKSVTVA